MRPNARRAAVALCVGMCLVALPAQAQLPNFDEVDSQPAASEPTFVWGDQVKPDDPAVLGTRARALASLAPRARAELAARAHLARLADRLAIASADLEQVELDHVHDTGRGAILVTFVQRLDGVRVEGRLVVAMNRELAVVAISGRLPGQGALRDESRRTFALPTAGIVENANRDMGKASPLANSGWSRTGDRDGLERFDRTDRAFATTLGDAESAPITVRRLFVAGLHGLEAAYQVDMVGETEAYTTIWSAVDGRLIRRTNIMHDLAHTYRVFAEPVPPYRPLQNPAGALANPITQPIGDLSIPLFLTPVLLTLDHGPIPTLDPWLLPGATTTISNHADAYTDLVYPDGFDIAEVRVPLTTPLTFDHAYNTTLAPNASSTQRHAATVNAFYGANWLHDWFYAAGFDEVSKNAQASNFGRGGAENDRMKVEVQDFASTNNANMTTPADGAPPRMQLFRFTYMPPGVTTPVRDVALDFDVVAHEWAHHLTSRLEPTLYNSNVGRGMGEGYSDFAALLTGLRSDDTLTAGGEDFNGRYGTARYALATWDFGLRRYPYCVDTLVNGLKFRHIQSGQPLPTSPKNPLGNSGNASVHATGEVWCTMLWEAFHTLLNKPGLGVEEARDRMRDYLVASLKLLPAKPAFTLGRDALLAVVAASHPEEVVPMGEAFARRGLGSNAVDAPITSGLNQPVVESYEFGRSFAYVGAQLITGLEDCDGDAYVDPGEVGIVRVTARNTGPLPVNGVNITVTPTDPRVVFPAGDNFPFPSLPPFSEESVDVPVTILGVTDSATVTFTMTMGSYDEVVSPNPVIRAHGFKVAVDLLQSYTDDFEFTEFLWTPAGTNPDPLTTWHRVPVGDDGQVAHGPAYPVTAHQTATSPVMNLPVGNHSISFRTAYDFDATDGGLIQYRTCSTCAWQDLTTDAPNLMPYTGTIPVGFGNPLEGKTAFVGQSPGFPAMQNVSFEFPVAGAATDVRFRLVVGSDTTGVGGEGFFVDDFSVPTASTPPFIGELRDEGDCVTVGAPPVSAPQELRFALLGEQPSRGATRLRFDLPRAMGVELAIHDVGGRRVAVLTRGERPAGVHEVEWKADRVSPGVFFARLSTPMGLRVVRLVMLK